MKRLLLALGMLLLRGCGLTPCLAAAPDWQAQSYASPDNIVWFYRAGVDTLITDGRFRAWPVGADSSLQKNQWDGTYVSAQKGTKFALSRNGVKLRDGWYYTKRIAGVDSLFGMYFFHGDQAAVAAVDDTSLASSAVTTAKLAAAAVTTSKILDANVTTAKLADDSVTGPKIATDAVGSDELAAGAVGTSELADGTVADADLAGSISFSKFSTTGAATNDVIAYNGSAWAKTSTIATPINTTTVTASGATTLNGAVTLGDAAGDAITSTGNFTTTGTTTCGNDTTDVVTVRGQPRWPDAVVCANFDSGSAIDTFTFPNAQAGWHFNAMFQDTNGKTIKSVYRSGSNTVTVETGTSVTVTSKICIWGWKP